MRNLFVAFILAVTYRSVLDMWLWSCLGTHAGFACLYTCWAQVLDTGRAGVLLVVCVHQLASSGVQKLRVGGWCGWAHPETMAQTLRFSLQVPNYDTHPCSNKTPTRTQTRVPSAHKLTRVLVLQELNKRNTQYRIRSGKASETLWNRGSL